MEDINTRKPEFVHPDKLFVPDITFLTRVKLPKRIDLKDKEAVVELLGKLVEEEKKINSNYAGMFLHGSVSRGEANNGSDIDGVHVIYGKELAHPDYEYTWSIRYRFDAIFKECFGIPVQDNRYVVNLSDWRTFQRNTDELDEHAIPLGLRKEQIEEIDSVTHFQKRKKYSGNRLFKAASVDVGEHSFSYPRGGIFPWYSEYGLLERISK